MAQAPWYTFPRIDNFGLKDPAGDFWKPDSNVQIPGNYPITALLPGTVTSVRQTDFGQTVVTVKLDHALNDLATYTFYEHMSSATVRTGDHLNAGDLLGYNNPGGAVPLGFGFYSGPVYGSGPAWTTLQQDLCPGCPGKLNPVKILDAAKAGKLGSYADTSGAPPASSGENCGADPICILTSWFTGWLAPQLKVWGEYIGIFVLALILIVVGFVLLNERAANQLIRKVA